MNRLLSLSLLLLATTGCNESTNTHETDSFYQPDDYAEASHIEEKPYLASPGPTSALVRWSDLSHYDESALNGKWVWPNLVTHYKEDSGAYSVKKFNGEAMDKRGRWKFLRLTSGDYTNNLNETISEQNFHDVVSTMIADNDIPMDLITIAVPPVSEHNQATSIFGSGLPGYVSKYGCLSLDDSLIDNDYSGECKTVFANTQVVHKDHGYFDFYRWLNYSLFGFDNIYFYSVPMNFIVDPQNNIRYVQGHLDYYKSLNEVSSGPSGVGIGATHPVPYLDLRCAGGCSAVQLDNFEQTLDVSLSDIMKSELQLPSESRAVNGELGLTKSKESTSLSMAVLSLSKAFSIKPKDFNMSGLRKYLSDGLSVSAPSGSSACSPYCMSDISPSIIYRPAIQGSNLPAEGPNSADREAMLIQWEKIGSDFMTDWNAEQEG